MKRIAVVLWASFLLAMATPAGAQTAGKVYRLAVVTQTESSLQSARAFTLPELSRLGYVEGRNLQVQAHSGSAETLPEVARDLIADRPDAIYVIGTLAARIVREQTDSVPIVMMGDDPVRLGYAQGYARPGGNVTGISILAAELDAKRLHLLLEAVPGARRIAALARRSHQTSRDAEQRMREVADAAGVEFLAFDAKTPDLYQTAFAAMTAQRTQAVVIVSDPVLMRDRRQLTALALDARLPTVCEWAEMAHAGCLLSYGPRLGEIQQRLAIFIARIFAGTSPAEIPIEQPARFDLVVNLRVAKALGLELPASILARADEVIE